MKSHHFLILFFTFLGSASYAKGNHAGRHNEHTAAIGQAGKASQVTRTIHIEMNDNMRFTPADMEVKQGETIKFVVKNLGKLKHEMVLGTEVDLRAHAELMKKYPNMEHDEPNQVSVDAGKSAEMIWMFTKAGKINFGCLQPGHFDAGMKGVVSVNKKSVNQKMVK